MTTGQTIIGVELAALQLAVIYMFQPLGNVQHAKAVA